MKSKFQFPFGQYLTPVVQQSRTPKKVFVLGVYASAVHARWVDVNGKQKVSALAVASEPEIFWKGENAAEIISSISIPKELGRLEVPTNKSFNGPSGIALDKYFLEPLGFKRYEAWLCDLLPESRVNPWQREAINKHYKSIAPQFNLPEASIPDFTQKLIKSNDRRNQILNELEESKADTIVLLGDLPIKYFLKHVSNIKYSKLSDFTPYGIAHLAIINKKEYTVYALCHPRQAAKLGMSNKLWNDKHQLWMRTQTI